TEKAPEKKSEQEPKEKKPEEGDKKSSTGYGDEPKEVTEPEKKPDEKPPEGDLEKKLDESKPPEGDEFKVTDKGDLLDSEVKQIEDFAKKHKLSKEQAEALVQDKKEEIKKLSESIENQKK